MKKANRFEIRVAGFGGQGIVTIGRILGTAFSVFEGRNSVNTQSYGPESRGGACRSELIVSEGIINYPYVRHADVLVALSQLALDTYIGNLKAGGVLLVDPNSVEAITDDRRFHVYEVPAMNTAVGCGSVQYQNAVVLGALYALIDDMIEEDSLRQVLSKNVPPDTVDANILAFERGIQYVRRHYPST